MPIATNPDTGEVVFLDDNGKWNPAKTAVNPQTREMMAFDGRNWQKVTSHGHGVLGYIDDAVRAVASGMTFGYADEIAAKMDELTGRGGTYAQNVARERSRDESIPTAIKLPGEIVGGVMSSIAASPVIGAGAVATGASKLPAVVRAMGAGAAAGGLYASGEAEGGLQNRLEAAVPGAAIGALGGAALSGTGRVISHIRNPAGRADAELSRAIQRDQGIPGSVVPGKEDVTTLADVGGENVKGLMERVAQTPGAGRSQIVPALTDRQKSQLVRISQDLKDLTGTSKTSMQATEDQIKIRNESAAPLYKQAFAEGDKPIWSDTLERISSVPEVKSAMRGAVSGWQRSQIASGYGAMNPGAMVDKEAGGILKFLNGKVPVFPNLQFWDYTKNALDDMISKEIKDDGTITKKGRDLTIIVGKLREELDKAVTSYSGAREAWSGPSSYLNAIKLGKGIRSQSPEEVSSTIRRMSEADREGYRIGAITQIINTLGESSAKVPDFTRALNSPNMRGKISAIMPNAQSAAKWHQRLSSESGFSTTAQRSLGGSQTARRLAEMEDSKSIVPEMVSDIFRGRPPVGLFDKVIQGTYGKIRDTLRSRTDAELAKKLLGRPSALQQ